jgi:hypothetical protein
MSPHWHDPIIGARVPAVTRFKATEIPGVATENWSLVVAVYAVPAPPKAIVVLNMAIGVRVPHVIVATGCRLVATEPHKIRVAAVVAAKLPSMRSR